MRTTTLGESGLRVPVMGLGCMGMSEFYGPHDDRQSLRTLERALELGVAFWDTADAYGSGRNEELLARVLKQRRDDVVLASKFGIVRGSDGSILGIDGSPAYARRACDASLARLGVESLDLYYLHRVDPNTPIEDSVGAMAELVRAGKVRCLGLSEASPDTLRRAASVHPITALQTEYSLWSRDPEAEILAACAELGVAFVAYSPLGRGFLTGKLRRAEDLADDDWRRNNPRFTPDNLARNLEVLARLEEIAASKGCTPAQLALAWVHARDERIVSIPGTRSAARLEENVAALDVTLTAGDLARIDEIAPRGAFAGQRYPEAALRAIDG